MQSLALLLQAAEGPSANVWLVLFTTIAGAMAAVFGTMTLTQRTLVTTLKDELASCLHDAKERVDRAERREDIAVDKLAGSTATISELASAVKEFATIGRSTAEGQQRNGERMESMLRRFDGLERTMSDIAYNRPRSPSADRHTNPGK